MASGGSDPWRFSSSVSGVLLVLLLVEVVVAAVVVVARRAAQHAKKSTARPGERRPVGNVIPTI